MRIATLALLIAFCSILANAQACGFIYAKFQIANAKGEVVEDAKLQLLYPNTNKSIMYREGEISYSKTEKAYKFRHGLCGEHNNTLLIVSHREYAKYEGHIDLPLNTLATEKIFTIRLTKKSERENVKQATLPIVKSETQQKSLLTGMVYDARGSVVPGIKIVAVNSEGKSFASVTNEEGVYILNLPYNEYPGSGFFKATQYDLIVESQKGFQRSETRGFVFIPAYSGKMYFDIALGVPPPIFD
jgi:hypothetical protein